MIKITKIPVEFRMNDRGANALIGIFVAVANKAIPISSGRGEAMMKLARTGRR